MEYSENVTVCGVSRIKHPNYKISSPMKSR